MAATGFSLPFWSVDRETGPGVGRARHDAVPLWWQTCWRRSRTLPAARAAEPMIAGTPLAELLEALAGGLARPRHAWEAAVIALAVTLGAVLARSWQGFFAQYSLRPWSDRSAGADLPARARAVGRLLFPSISLALLWAGEAALRAVHVLASAADARLLRLASTLVATLVVVRVLFALGRRVLHSGALVARFERGVGAMAILVAALYATGALGDVVEWLAATRIPLGTSAKLSLWSLLVGSVTTLVSLLGAMWLGSLIEERLAAESALEPNLRTVLGRLARALLLLLALLLALGLSGIDLTVLSVFGGALGVGLGLGLQRIAGNYVSGFILLLDRSLRIGDVITIDKYYGRVLRITTRYTVLRSMDGTEAIVPNEMVVSSPVVNSTLSDRRVVLSLQLAIGPHEDLDLALELLRQAAAEVPRVLPEPPPGAQLKEFAAGNLLLECNFSIADPENGRQNVISDVAIAIYHRLRKQGIVPAAPHTAVSVLGPGRLPYTQPAEP